MNPALDGWFVLKQHAPVVASALGFMLWGAAIGIGFLKKHGLQELGADEILSLAAAAWMPAALLLAGLALVVGAMIPRWPYGPVALTLPAFASLLWIWSPRQHAAWARRESWPAAILLAAAFVALALLRLAFVKGIALPVYFDSAMHFGLIQQLVQNAGRAGWQAPLALPLPGYYHLGYHVLVAGLARATGIEIASAMLVFGQVLLAVLPFSLYLLAHRSTGSRLAAMLAVTLGALGWSMPAHAVNWGKYPALFGLPAMLGAVSLAYIASRSETASPARRAWFLAASLCALATVLIHTRLGLVLIMLSGVWVLSGIWIALTPLRRTLLSALLLLPAAVLVTFISRDPIQSQVLEPFVNSGIWATALVSLSLPLAFRSFPRITFALALQAVFLLAGLFAPVPAGRMLDRPLVEMLLPLLLSLLGAAGVAGFLQILPSANQHIGRAAAVVLSAAVVAQAILTQGFSPSACCEMVATDDLVALDWLRREAPVNSRVVVATAPVQVSPGSYASLEAGADAGIWIRPLTGLSVSSLSFATDFGSVVTHSMLCEMGVDAVYAGGAPRSFDVAALLAEPQWYELRLQLPAVSVFEVTACGRGST